jgi:hypothetical protein
MLLKYCLGDFEMAQVVPIIIIIIIIIIINNIILSSTQVSSLPFKLSDEMFVLFVYIPSLLYSPIQWRHPDFALTRTVARFSYK